MTGVQTCALPIYSTFPLTNGEIEYEILGNEIQIKNNPLKKIAPVIKITPIDETYLIIYTIRRNIDQYSGNKDEELKCEKIVKDEIDAESINSFISIIENFNQKWQIDNQ